MLLGGPSLSLWFPCIFFFFLALRFFLSRLMPERSVVPKPKVFLSMLELGIIQLCYFLWLAWRCVQQLRSCWVKVTNRDTVLLFSGESPCLQAHSRKDKPARFPVVVLSRLISWCDHRSDHKELVIWLHMWINCSTFAELRCTAPHVRGSAMIALILAFLSRVILKAGFRFLLSSGKEN